MIDTLKQHFESVLNLPDDASEFLIDLWNATQVFDDFADGDEVERSDLDKAIWASLAGMQINPFYAKNAHMLVPVISLAILKWQASDRVEREGKADARSYMWRAGYFDVVCMVTVLVHGPTTQNALAALSLVGETYDEYRKEFNIG